MRLSIYFYVRLFVCVPVFLIAVSASAGGTSVGDGGHGVLCHEGEPNQTIEPLESYELRFEGRAVVIGNDLDGFSKGIDKVTKLFSLKPEEEARLRSVPWRLTNRAWLPPKVARCVIDVVWKTLGQPDISSALARSMKRQNCKLVPIAIRSDYFLYSVRAAFASGVYGPGGDEIAARLGLYECGYAEPGMCIVVDERYWSQLSGASKAVMYLHESLRFLPDRFRPESNDELRFWVKDLVSY